MLFKHAEWSISLSFMGSHNPIGSKNSATLDIITLRVNDADLSIFSASNSVRTGVGLDSCIPPIFLLTFSSEGSQ